MWETREGEEDMSHASPAATTDLGEVTTTTADGTDGWVGDSDGYDFRHMDHRMTLYLMMSIFDNDDEFRFKVKVSSTAMERPSMH